MKYTSSIFLAAALAVCSVQAQNTKKGFTIKGEFGTPANIDSIFIYTGENEKIAGAPIINNKFEIKGYTHQPRNASFAAYINEELIGFGKFILDNDNYTYVRNKPYDQRIKGGKIHDLVLGFESTDAFKNASEDYDNTMEAIYTQTGATENYDPTQEEKAKIHEKTEAILNIEDSALFPVIENPNVPVAARVFAIERVQNWEKYPPEKRIELLESYKKQLDKPLQALESLLEFYQSEVNATEYRKNIAEGMPFKDIEARDINGNIVKLSDVVAKNKFTILEFWASWCGPCRGEIPNLKKAYKKYKSKGLEIYAISFDHKEAKWLEALKEEKTPWINLLDEQNYKGKAAADYAVRGIPASFLIDQKGIIRASDNGLRGKDLDKTLSALMP